MTNQIQASCIITKHGLSNQKLLEQSRNAFKELISQISKISRSINVKPVQEVSELLLNHLTLRVIEQQQPDRIFVGDYDQSPVTSINQSNLPVVFFIERVALFAPHIQRTNGFAFYIRHFDDGEGFKALGNFIGLRNPASFTSLFQAINLFHEAKHALDHRCIPDYATLELQQRETPAHLVEILIMRFYGGRKLISIAMKYAGRIGKKTGLPLQHCDKQTFAQYVANYDDKLDEIFGKALSERERNLRMDRYLAGFVFNPRLKDL